MARIRDLMDKHIVAVSKTTSVGLAMKLMRQAHVSVLPVLDDQKLLGVLTMNEMEHYSEIKRVGEVNLRMLFAEADDTAETAAKTMVIHKLNRLPVVNNKEDMKCIGIVSSTEIAKSYKNRL